jgi:hypothetical protein
MSLPLYQTHYNMIDRPLYKDFLNTASSLLRLSLLFHLSQLLAETHLGVNILLVKRLSFQKGLDQTFKVWMLLVGRVGGADLETSCH